MWLVPAWACGHKKTAKIQNFRMDTGKHGGGTPQSTLRAALPAYDRKKSRNPITDSDSQLRMHDATKADARGKVVVLGGNCKCWEYDEEIRRGVRYVVPEESRCVWFAGGEI